MCKFRDLTKDEIDVRIGQTKEKYITLLLYKDARVDMNMLDETVGNGKWQREHYEVKGNLYCRVGIKLDDEWVWKSECGVESNAEAEKGEASDSFKRACVNWGIGRELYTSPEIKIFSENCEIKKSEFQGKATFKCYDTFKVEKILIENKTITAIAIWNVTQNKRAFVWQAKK